MNPAKSGTQVSPQRHLRPMLGYPIVCQNLTQIVRHSSSYSAEILPFIRSVSAFAIESPKPVESRDAFCV